MTDEKIKDARLALQAAVVRSVMKDVDDYVKVEPLGNGDLTVAATHRIECRGVVVYANSEKDAEVARAAFKALMLATAVKFSQELVGRRFA